MVRSVQIDSTSVMARNIPNQTGSNKDFSKERGDRITLCHAQDTYLTDFQVEQHCAFAESLSDEQ